MKPYKIRKCPNCKGKDLRVGYINPPAKMCMTEDCFLDDLCIINSIICADCGSIVLSWVDKPEIYPKLPKK